MFSFNSTLVGLAGDMLENRAEYVIPRVVVMKLCAGVELQIAAAVFLDEILDGEIVA